jgi:lysyl-tRNA synthetase class 2
MADEKKNVRPQNAESASASGGGDQVADRRAKLAKLREELGVDPYGGREEDLVSLADARASYDDVADDSFKEAPERDERPVVKVAGRVVLHRDIGKLVFATLRDGTGDLQVAISKKSVDATSFQVAKLADLGDMLVVTGPLGTTKTGEITIWATGEGTVKMACKSLAVPPEKWSGLSDPELRYRQRYVDLYANSEVMQMMKLRIRIVDEIRDYFRGRGFAEVETPMLQPIHGGAAARPFITHHNALDMRLYLRIAPELYLKRLLVGGFDKVFEVNRNFRNEGISPRHNPEFTMLESYEAFGSWETMADLVEDMVCTVAMKVFGTLAIEHKNADGEVTKTINLQRPWRRVRMDALVAERTGWKFDKQPLATEQIDKLRAANPGKDLKLDGSPAEQLVEVYEKVIEHTLIDPCFVTHVPSVVIPLARENRDDPFFADVYELAINGQEISPGYTELNDPEVQEAHFRGQVGEREEQQAVDEDFLNALRVGMPPAGGMGLGIDRLVMMLTGAESIRDVILFPLMRPKDTE